MRNYLKGQSEVFTEVKGDSKGVDEDITIRGVLLTLGAKNANGWAIRPQDGDYLIEALRGLPLRSTHSEDPMSTYGKIIDAWREGDTIFYRANVFGNDSKALRIIREGLAKSVSIAVEFSKTVCSSCGKLARDNQEPNLLQHLCENAHELVIDPKPYEVSLVSFPAYKESSISVAGKKQRSLVNLLDRLDTVTNDLLRKRREADGKGKPETLPDSPEDDQDDAPVTRKGKSGSSLLDKTNWKRPREEKPVTVGPTPSMINMHSFREAESAYRAKEILESVDIFGKERILLVDPLMAELRKVKARKQ